MSQLCRIGIAIEEDLLQQFDQLTERRNYPNRSEAFRDLVRDALSAEVTEQPDQDVVGTVTLIYDHHVRLLTEKLNSLQHDHHDLIVSTLHVHLDHDHCLEVLVVRGKSQQVRDVAGRLTSTKGVKQGHLVLTTARLDQAGAEGHRHDPPAA